MVAEGKFIECHLHAGKVAVRDCRYCGKPICKECASESGDPSTCRPCRDLREKEAKSEGTIRVGAGGKRRPSTEPAGKDEEGEPQSIGVREREPKPFDIGEVTVLDDGHVVSPPGPRERAGTVEAEAEAMEGPPTMDVLAPSEEPAERTPSPGLEPEGPASEGPPVQAKRIPVEKVASKREPVPERASATGSPDGPRAVTTPSGRLRQFLESLAYGLLAGSGVYVFWILFAISRRWTQVSVVTAGLVIPWALLKGSTAGKKGGEKKWESPLPPALASIGSAILLLLLTLPAEYFALRLVFRGSDLKNPLAEFTKIYFNRTGIILVAVGFVLAVVTPFILASGESAGRKRKSLED